MATTIQLRSKAHARPTSAHPQRTDALSGGRLKAADRAMINPHRVVIYRHLAESLRRIGMEQNPTLLTELSNLGNRLHRPNLVVGHHNGNENGLVVHRLGNLLRMNEAHIVDGQIRHTEAPSLQTLARIQD